jgi:LuxR family maltose regulon positive regulatory protein
MLKEIADSNLYDEYVGRVLACSERYIDSLKNAQLSKVSLSQREAEVLALTAEGLKRDEIASRLYLSQGTVKTHLQNIYQKLDASGKMSAIKIAQMHGLI